MSLLIQQAVDLTGNVLCIYRDPATLLGYSCKQHIEVLCLEQSQKQYHQAMNVICTAVEWLFRDIAY